LRKVAEDQTASIDARRNALRQLSILSEDEVLLTAAKLIADPAPQLKSEAVELLSSSVVMAGHGNQGPSPDDHGVPSSSSPWSTYVRSQHEFVRDALRTATQIAPPETQLIALRALVQFADEGAIDLVKQASASGAISQTQAVQICGLAANNDGRACLIDFLDTGSIEGRIAAVNVLGSIPSNRSMVRNKVFLNDQAQPSLRAAAADVLGIYDPSFASYALTITSDPKTPPLLYAATLRSYAANVQEAGKLDAAQRSVIRRAVENKLQSAQDRGGFQGSDLKPLSDLLEKFRQ
jgi:hypothetical protein